MLMFTPKMTNGQRAAHCNGDGHDETVTLAGHATGAPFAVLNVHDQGGEIAATQDLLQRCDITGHIITVDALHTTRKTASLITQTADDVVTVKGHAPDTFDILKTIDWDRDATGHVTEDWNKDHGRLEQRSINVFTPPAGLIHDPNLQQVARITRDREPLKPVPADPDHTSPTSIETTSIITSLDAETASPEDLLRTNRGHGSVDNRHHRHRDVFFAEDACPMRTGTGPANRARLNTLALAVVLTNRRPHEGFATARRRLHNRTQDAIKALVTAEPVHPAHPDRLTRGRRRAIASQIALRSMQNRITDHPIGTTEPLNHHASVTNTAIVPQMITVS